MNTLLDVRFRLLGVAMLACCLALPWTALAQNDIDTPTATLNIENMIPGGEALLPTNNWAPLFRIEMTTDEDEPAPRTLASLRFTITEDPDAGDRAYDALVEALMQRHFHEFAIIFEAGGPEGVGANADYGVLGKDMNAFPGPGAHDFVSVVWGADGEPLTEADGLTYTLDFIGNGTADNPDIPLPIVHPEGTSYIVAVRTSAYWHHGLSFTYEAVQAWMVHQSHPAHDGWEGDVADLPFGLLVDEDDEWLDEYPWAPDEPWVFDPDADDVYTSSFGVFDETGHLTETPNGQAGSWAWPLKVYTPLPEFSRPRWDQSATAFDFVQANVMQLRRLFSIETWYSVLGINMRGTSASAMEFGARSIGDEFHPELRGDLRTEESLGLPLMRLDAPYPIELHIVMTDIGGDPLGPPGNGGFDPREGLEKIVYDNLTALDEAYQTPVNPKGDSAFNGVWLYRDTTGNHIFERPVPAAEGVQLIDKPMFPWGFPQPDDQFVYPWPWDPMLPVPGLVDPAWDPNDVQWKHIPNPPHGSDPWWQLSMLYGGGRDASGNRMDPTPSPAPINLPSSNLLPDYFVTVRADSGYADSSMAPGDGVGINFGAESKLIVEPRRPDAPFQGGMLVSSQFPLEAFFYGLPWSAHPSLSPDDSHEQWWPLRTHNQNVTKSFRFGLEVHDYVQLHSSWSDWFTHTLSISYPQVEDHGLMMIAIWPYNVGLPAGYLMGLTGFDLYMDPFGALSGQFRDGYTVGGLSSLLSLPGIQMQAGLKQPYESVPFRSIFDAPLPRSNHYPNPDLQPTRPHFQTWPGKPGTPPYRVANFPQESDWNNAEHVRARKLHQRVGAQSDPTPMLGINLVGVNDPRTMQFLEEQTGGAAMTLEEITVAFWGPDLNGNGLPDFDPSWLRPLAPNGLGDSGVALYGDTGAGVFSGLPGGSAPIELRNLSWSAAPEYIDLSGDGEPDDLNGDGFISELDKAWVVRLRPQEPWFLPAEDFSAAPFAQASPGGQFAAANSQTPAPADVSTLLSSPDAIEQVNALGGRLVEGDPHWSSHPMTLDLGVDIYNSKPEPLVQQAPSVPQPPSGNVFETQQPGDPDRQGYGGDGLYVVVRTSDQGRRFGRFKAMIPSSLPERTNPQQREAGIRIAPGFATAPQAYNITHPEENVGDVPFFGHDLLENNVPIRIQNLASANQALLTSGAPRAVLGIEASTNRGAEGRAASGNSGTPGARTFTVSGANWASGSMTGYFLIDEQFEAYEIVGNSSNQLNLLSGTPRPGPWYIAKDPTFLEQVVVEFYPEPGAPNISPLDTLMPLDQNPDLSGVALYRDNNNHPQNRIGVFDPGIDLPVHLDHPPFFVGTVGEPRYQVMFVFSSPGTSGMPVPGAAQGVENQPRRRQVIPDSFGPGFPRDAGPDFFVVLRATEDADLDVSFRVGIVGWGPATPTMPDPHIFPPPSRGQIYEHKIFDEFPFGSRGLGFISVFSDIRNYDPLDSSGYNWIRTRTHQARRSNPIQIERPDVQPSDLTITSVEPTRLPTTVPAGGVMLTIRGTNFGTSPQVRLNDVALTVQSVTPTRITAQIPAATTLTAPVTLRVSRPTIGQSATWSQFTLVTPQEWEDIIDDIEFGEPTITSVTPNSGGQEVFPVTIKGTRFDFPEVFFNQTRMPVIEWEPTRIEIGFPSGGIASAGSLDVRVRNTTSQLSVTLEDGFYFDNPPAKMQVCFIATAAYGTPTETRLDVLRGFRDGVLLKSAVGAATVDAYYAMSPPVADRVASSPFLALLVRVALEPVILVLQSPLVSLVLLVTGIAAALYIGRVMISRRRRSAAQA